MLSQLLIIQGYASFFDNFVINILKKWVIVSEKFKKL